MKLETIQTSFAGGEFGPQLYGRTDIAQYANACEIVENFLIRPYGSAVSYPGTKYVATVSDSTLRARLIPFVFNKTDSYVIEMGDLYMRFFTNRGQVVTPGGTEDLSAFSANLKAHYKMNDNTNSTTVIDTVGTHNGTLGTLTSSVTTTAIVDKGFDLDGRYHISVADHANFTRTASTQPMTVSAWGYYVKNGQDQTLFSKAGEYELAVTSADKLRYKATSGTGNVKLLLHGDGADASTTITDSSTTGHTVTASGNAQIDTAQSKFGGASIRFDGTTDYVEAPSHADFDIDTGDFTVDFWVRLNTHSAEKCLFQTAANFYMTWHVYDGGRFDMNIGGATGSAFYATVLNTWVHVALVRSSGVANLYVNGTSLASFAANTDIAQAAVRIGASASGAVQSLDGWIDEFRLVKGAAVWTSNFTVPDAPYQSAETNTWESAEAIDKGWHLFSSVFKGDGSAEADCALYLDGEVLDATFTGAAGFVKMEDTASLFRIGASSSAGAKGWGDKMDNLSFIHQELTAAEVAALYSESVYQITTIFRESELFDIHFTQLNDVIWLTHKSRPVQKLTRSSANEWAIASESFKGGPFMDDNTNTAITITPSATSGTINITVSPTSTTLFTRSGSTLGHHNVYWMIGGLAQTNTTTGLQEHGYVQITNVVNSYTATATVIKNLKAAAATSVWAEGAWSAVRGYPSRVVFHDSRLWLGRTDAEPQKIWGSKIFEYDAYALDTQDDDDGLNLALVSNEANELQWMASTKNLLTGTYGGGFVVSSGADNLAITPDNARANEEIGIGSAAIQPKRLGNFIYFLQRFRNKLRELLYVWDLNTYKAVDRTILSPHILGSGAVDMAVQRDPDPVLICVRTDGTLATLTREADQEFAAWSRQTTNGTYTSVVVIPSQQEDYDEAWVIVERWVNGNQRKYVEYFVNPAVPLRQDQCVYLHSTLTYDAYNSTSLSSCTISLSASSGSITITSSTAYFDQGHVNKRIRAIDADGNTIGEGTITAANSTTSITLTTTTTFSALNYAAGCWGVSVVSVAGADHLDGKTVGVLADGAVESLTRTIASGTVTMGSNYFVVHVGLPYTQIIKTLRKEVAAQRGTAQGKLQRICEIAFKLVRSYLGFQYGLDASNLDTLTSVDTTLTQSLTTGVIGNVPFRGGYQRGTQIYIKNVNPLPIEIESIVATIDTQEK